MNKYTTSHDNETAEWYLASRFSCDYQDALITFWGDRYGSSSGDSSLLQLPPVTTTSVGIWDFYSSMTVSYICSRTRGHR